MFTSHLFSLDSSGLRLPLVTAVGKLLEVLDLSTLHEDQDQGSANQHLDPGWSDHSPPLLLSVTHHNRILDVHGHPGRKISWDIRNFNQRWCVLLVHVVHRGVQLPLRCHWKFWNMSFQVQNNYIEMFCETSPMVYFGMLSIHFYSYMQPLKPLFRAWLQLPDSKLRQ